MFSIISALLGLYVRAPGRAASPATPCAASRAIREETELGGARGGARAAARLAALVANELVIFPARMVPFAARTLRYRRAQMREVKLGERVLEVYERGGADGPLILYVHGGSWGQGAPWNYALMARRLLDGGAARVAVAQYGLFPAADVDEMVGDLDAALRWAEAEAGGSEVRLVGQSAGAHLCAALARAARRRRALRGEPVGWLPSKFVALSGVYDIAAHFAHENTRLVHWLSPMWLAMAAGAAMRPPTTTQFARLVLERAGLGGAAVPPSAAPASSRPKASTPTPSRARRRSTAAAKEQASGTAPRWRIGAPRARRGCCGCCGCARPRRSAPRGRRPPCSTPPTTARCRCGRRASLSTR